MRISILTKLSISTRSVKSKINYAQRRWFFSKASWKKPFSLPKCLVQPWSGRPVLTFGKHPCFTGLVKVLTFCWLFSAVLSVSGYKYMWASQYVRSRTGRLLLERLQVAEEENQDIDITSVSADCKHPTGFPAPFLKIFIAQSITYSTFYFYPNLYL